MDEFEAKQAFKEGEVEKGFVEELPVDVILQFGMLPFIPPRVMGAEIGTPGGGAKVRGDMVSDTLPCDREGNLTGREEDGLVEYRECGAEGLSSKAVTRNIELCGPRELLPVRGVVLVTFDKFKEDLGRAQAMDCFQNLESHVRFGEECMSRGDLGVRLERPLKSVNETLAVGVAEQSWEWGRG